MPRPVLPINIVAALDTLEDYILQKKEAIKNGGLPDGTFKFPDLRNERKYYHNTQLNDLRVEMLQILETSC
jgi:hypothetical protein